MHRHTFAITMASAALLVMGCTAEVINPEEQQRSEDSIAAGEAPLSFVNSKGLRFVRRGPAKNADSLAAGPKVRGASRRDAAPRVPVAERMTREQLAEALRPVTAINGYEYILDGPAYQIADAVIAARGKELRSPPGSGKAAPPGVDLTPGTLQSQAIIGTDDRDRMRDNTSGAAAATVLITDSKWNTDPSNAAKCTGTVIGPTTILTAAHCLVSGGAMVWGFKWSPGVDSQDSNPFPYQASYFYPDPSGVAPMGGCYEPAVPSGYLTAADEWEELDFDYGVMEIMPACGYQPGNQVGWLGIGVFSDSFIEQASGYLNGYPSITPFGYPNTWPQIWGEHGPLEAAGDLVEYDIDTTSGQSGAGVYRFDSASNRYIVAIHSRPYTNWLGTTWNMGRRITTDVHNFIIWNSSL
ncbi:hypothetical protein WMF28_31655 [Sorangium sp. So ce590]|uniref:trypsin-like serine peptidase n=1 Tax=Sorangium sp. So ce590 TaxID=3133317 RepID=UPI003F5E6DF6